MNRLPLVLAVLLVPALAFASKDGPPPAPAVGTIWSLAPAAVAIVLALVTRQVLLSLIGGVWLGAALLQGGFFAAFPGTMDTLIVVAADKDKLKVITFTLFMGGLVGVIAGSGGTKGIVDVVSRVAKTRRSGGLATWGMGLAVFFDDYASTLLVGSTMRPITDKLRISREKLSYMVDSTAAPIASLAVVSTWIGYEVSVMGDAMKAAGVTGEGYDPYQIFLSGIPSRFYPILALLMVGLLAWTGREFGPMLAAERRARSTGEVLRAGGRPLMDANIVEDQKKLDEIDGRWWLAVLPVVSLVGCVLAVLFVKGPDASYDALLYGSAFGVSVGMLASIAVGAQSMRESIDSFVSGVRAMTLAVMVLVLAWCIGKVMSDLDAGKYVAGLIADTVPSWGLPTITFVLASVIALATGTSWGTMAILFPILLPVLAAHQTDPDFMNLLLGSTSAVLAGAVFGDHCSPISDTTVLSSIASAADHVDHTRTQAPYAALCAVIAIALGTLPMGLGVSPWILLPLQIAALYATIRFLGTPVAEDAVG
jgi:Na+/H+ antiporter NhaC